jgi:hypothetical protein
VRNTILKLGERFGSVLDSESRVKRLAPFFVLGPITGPLVAGVVLNLRRKKPVLASMYGYLLLYGTFVLPAQVVVWGTQLAS